MVNGAESLYLHIRGRRGYGHTVDVWEHLIWRLIGKRVSDEDVQKWTRQHLSTFGLIEITPRDVRNGDELGLLSAEDAYWEDIQLELDPSTLKSLDGLMLLAVLSRCAHRLGMTSQAAHVDKVMSCVANDLSADYQLSTGDREEWLFLVEKSLQGPQWPDRVSLQEIKNAADELRCDRAMPMDTERSMGSLDVHCAWIRAVRRRDQERRGQLFPYRDRCSMFGWLVRNCHEIEEHVSLAHMLAIGVDDEGPSRPPLRMPRNLARRRRRPDYGERGWELFGDQSPYDLIRIEIIDD
ncbi:hypothetical protein N791_07645 [Lysobacter defluvii IMMIB APB-9 = DSM 18482]|uniref:Uncharacterized protein n=2 Tax=Novilysobacter TaxID=3382699 RepID=A0A0A0MBJ0_9GAMM|nr:hypothetical protein N791_07645 [Lysobacter defluvii IMMIB APB-9 = DSM 18482]